MLRRRRARRCSINSGGFRHIQYFVTKIKEVQASESYLCPPQSLRISSCCVNIVEQSQNPGFEIHIPFKDTVAISRCVVSTTDIRIFDYD